MAVSHPLKSDIIVIVGYHSDWTVCFHGYQPRICARRCETMTAIASLPTAVQGKGDSPVPVAVAIRAGKTTLTSAKVTPTYST